MSWFAVSQMECKSTETKECCVSAQSFHSGVHALLHEKYKKRLEMFATCESPIVSWRLEGLASHVWMLPTSDSSSCRLSSEQACHALWSAIHLDRFQYIHIAWDTRFKITFQMLRDYATGHIHPKTDTKTICACQIVSVCYYGGILPISAATPDKIPLHVSISFICQATTSL